MAKNVAVYLCQGCELRESLDLDALQQLALDEGQGATCAQHACLCGDEGRALIASGIRDGADVVVIAACSPRCMSDAFCFDGCQVERVNLREQVAWSHEANDPDTQMLADDYLRMALVRAQKAERPVPVPTDAEQTVLVVGGGVSGLSAASAAAAAGHDVVLVEKEAELGGWLGHITHDVPWEPPYRDPAPTGVATRVAEVLGNPRIKVYTHARIDRIEGQPGQFEVTIANGEGPVQLRAGAVVQATGWRPYDPSRLAHLGFGRCANVITSIDFEKLLAAGQIARPSDGAPARRIAFIQCAGSRDKDHLPYCSSVCCAVTIKQALLARALDPAADTYIIYRDLRTPGQLEDFYRRAQEDEGIFFTKGTVVGVEGAAGDDVVIEAADGLLGERFQLQADLVVLATGMVPVATDGEALRQYQDAKAVVAKGDQGAQLDTARQTVERLAHLEDTGILNLAYRQGPDLPVLYDSFPDSHFICFPYETRRTGIYTAGCGRAPLDTQLCIEDGAGAALKAIQCIRLVGRGEAMQPRVGDHSVPEFALQRCTQCKRCTEECPFGALNEDVKGTPQPNPGRCRRCGICMGACPERIIGFKDYSIDLISSQIKTMHVPDEFEEKPRLLGFLCENDAYPALDVAGLRRTRHSPFIRFIPVRCLGSVNVVWIADALARGFDGILLVGCKSGPDYQCHMIRGSELMQTRSNNIRDKLKQLALEEERVRIEQLSISDFARLPEIVNDFAAQIADIGMNPFKGF